MRLWDDERAQSIQIGAVLLFGALVILFAVYQSTVVPNQNEQVEFNHNQRVEGDMVELRNAVLETRATGEDGFASVELGTQYPARLVGLNPNPPSGVLRTTDARRVVVEQGGSDITDDICPGSGVTTRTVQYQPSYSVYRSAGTVRYENSVVYHEFSENTVVLSGQQLVRDNEVQLTPLNGSFSEASTRTVSVDFKAGRLESSSRNDPTVVLPTGLSEDTWEEILDGEVDPANVSVTSGAAGRNLTLDLSGEYTISCGPVGVEQVPGSGARGSGTTGLNPAGPGQIRLVDDNRSGSRVSMFFNNTGGTNNFTEARINFYRTQSGNKPSQGDIFENGEPVSATLQVGGPFESLDPDIMLEGNGTVTEVVVDFDRNPNPNDFFIITFELETGETSLYFVPAK